MFYLEKKEEVGYIELLIFFFRLGFKVKIIVFQIIKIDNIEIYVFQSIYYGVEILWRIFLGYGEIIRAIVNNSVIFIKIFFLGWVFLGNYLCL